MFDLDGDTHDGGDGVSHDSDAVSVFVVGDGSLLHEVLIDTDESDGVTARNISDSLDLTGHHEDGSLDVLDVEVTLASGNVVGSHNSDLLASGDGSGEDTSESVETTLIVGGHHLGDEDHEGTVLVAVLDGLTAGILNGSLVEEGSSVSLGLDGGRQLHDDHLKKSFGGVDPLLVDALEEGFTFVILLLGLEDNVEGSEHLCDGFFLSIHDVTAEHDDGLHDELHEASGKLSIGTCIISGEFFGGGVEVVVAPELVHELLEGELELLGVDTGKAGEGESPSEEC